MFVDDFVRGPNMSINAEIAVLLIAIAQLIESVQNNAESAIALLLEVLQTFVLMVTGVLLYRYMKSTRALQGATEELAELQGENNKEQADANDLAGMTYVHSVMTNETGHQLRFYIYNNFEEYLKEAVIADAGNVKDPSKKHWIECFFTDGTRDKIRRYEVIVKMLAEREEPERSLDELEAFNHALRGKGDGAITSLGISHLEAVDRVLADIDIFAIPYKEGNRAAKKLAESYKLMLKRIAIPMLPYVAIQIGLRGDDDFKNHYLYMLDDLKIMPEPSVNE
jgi:hypothetical protein